ncbi:thymidine phosphorylase [bacterium]|nr:thymidine phosphorylase [bacterium]
MASLTPYEFISRKQAGEEYSRDELNEFLSLYMRGDIQDYQMTAWMMAVYFKGLTDKETSFLIDAMIGTGNRLSFPGFDTPLGDKHSTGGVGDKITLLLAPLVAECGLAIPTISGRGLGFTGGTLDKLESIPGFNTNLTVDEMQDQTRNIGLAFGAQTAELVPADRRMYALRDVTGTIRSYPLITSSIISKKAAEGIQGIVYDVKCGRGAFMQDEDEARELANWLVRISTEFGLNAAALITTMDAPLGRSVGNWLEVDECLRALRLKAIEPDIRQLTLALGGTLLSLCGVEKTPMEGWKKMDMAWSSGRALKRFMQAVRAQGGDVAALDEGVNPHPAEATLDITAEKGGYIHEVDAREIGFAGVELRAGRSTAEASIDPAAGFHFRLNAGDEVGEGEVIATLFGGSDSLLAQVAPRIQRSIRIEDFEPTLPPLLRSVVTPKGEFSWEEFKGMTIST